MCKTPIPSVKGTGISTVGTVEHWKSNIWETWILEQLIGGYLKQLFFKIQIFITFEWKCTELSKFLISLQVYKVAKSSKQKKNIGYHCPGRK